MMSENCLTLSKEINQLIWAIELSDQDTSFFYGMIDLFFKENYNVIPVGKYSCCYCNIYMTVIPWKQALCFSQI